MGNGVMLMERLLQQYKCCWFDAPPYQMIKMLDRRFWMCSCTPVVNYKYNLNSTLFSSVEEATNARCCVWVQTKAANYPANSSTIHMLRLDVTLSVLLSKP